MEPDHRRAGRHRAGAVGGVHPDGVLRRLDRRHLPPVLGHDRLGDGALGARRADPHAGPVRDAAQAGGGEHQAHAASFGWFNRSFDRDARTATRRRGRAMLVRHALAGGARYLVIAALVVLLFLRLPTAFLPDEDQGFLFVQVQRRRARRRTRRAACWSTIATTSSTGEGGRRVGVFTRRRASASSGSGQNVGLGFVTLKDWDERERRARRRRPSWRARWPRFGSSATRIVFAFAPPAVPELGNATGFDLELEDRGGLGHDALMQARRPAARHGRARDPRWRGAAQRAGGRAAVQARHR